MRRILGQAHRAVARFLFVAIIAGASSTAFASNVQFAGSVGYSSDYATFAILVINNIHNNDATGTSNNLRVELWATSSPFAGSFAGGYRLSTYGVAPLPAGASTGKITATTGFSPPPGGTWYVAMVLTEFTGAATNDGYSLRQYLNFSQTIWFPGSPDTTPPTAPSGLVATANGSTSINLSWTASTDNVAVTGYRVERCQGAGCSNFAQVATPGGTTFSNSGLLPATSYRYRVRATDAAGNVSAYSNIASATTTAAPDTTPPTAPTGLVATANGSSGINLSWAASTDNVAVTGYRLERCQGAGCSTFAQIGIPGGTTFADSGLVASTSYSYRVRASDAAGNLSGYSNTATATTNAAPDTTPPTVSITSPTGGDVSGIVTVSVSASDNVGVTHVDLLVNGASAGSDSSAPYQFAWNSASVPNGPTQLKAVAYDAAGNLAQSTVVTVTVANGGGGAPPDTIPPTVSIVSPTGGKVSGILTITATASDNVGVSRVDFYANGELVGTDASAPYQTTWDSASVPHLMANLTAVAFDAAGNSASATVTVTVAHLLRDNYQGLWWVPAGVESGWGINFVHQGDQVFATWYTYDATGRAWWLSMLANRISPTSDTYSGAIYIDHGPPFSSFAGAGVPIQVGNGALTFSDADNAVFDYSVNGVSQSKAITRFDLGTGPQVSCSYSASPNLAGATNYQDLWWVPGGEESGWGVNLVHQGDTIFATWYTYDLDGTPLWLSGLMQRVGATDVYAGPLLRTSGPRFDDYRSADLEPNQTVGSATLTFTNGNDATFTYTVQLAGMGAPMTQAKPITRFLFTAAGGTVCH